MLLSLNGKRGQFPPSQLLFLLTFWMLSVLAYGQERVIPVLSNYDAILLGEKTHGVRSFYEQKRALISTFQAGSEEELLLLVESPLVLSVIRKLEGQAADYHYPHTNTEENIRFFSQYLNFGFDLQEDCRYREFSAYLVREGYISPQDTDLITMDSLLSLCIYGDRYQREVLTNAEGTALKTAIEDVASRVLPQVQEQETFDLLQLCFTNRLHLAAYLQLPTNQRYQQRIQFRDSIMAENIKSFRQLEAEKSIVIWAANLHIGKKGVMGKKWTRDGVKSMAEYLEPDWNVCRIAISEKRDKTAMFFDQVILTPERVLIDAKYLADPCHQKMGKKN